VLPVRKDNTLFCYFFTSPPAPPPLAEDL
jgi:hypothetical protein